MKELNLDVVGKVAKGLGVILFYGALAAVSKGKIEHTCYSDAVEAITKSSMWSSDKQEAITALKRYGDEEYYKAIVLIVKDDSTWSSDKLDMIEKLSLK